MAKRKIPTVDILTTGISPNNVIYSTNDYRVPKGKVRAVVKKAQAELKQRGCTGINSECVQRVIFY
jgi:hypothetical protein